MKRMWTQTLAWIAAVVAAVLFALASPAGLSLLFEDVSLPGALP